MSEFPTFLIMNIQREREREREREIEEEGRERVRRAGKVRCGRGGGEA